MERSVKTILKNEKGFTLIEMLVVLAIFLVIHVAILYFSHEPIVEFTEKQLMNQNELLIRRAQLLTIETLNAHSFRVVNCRTIYITDRSKNIEIYEQILPKHIDMLIATSNSSLIFNTRGNVQEIGGLTYSFGRESHRYSVNLGKATILEKGVFYDPERDNTCRDNVSSRHFILSHINNHSSYA